MRSTTIRWRLTLWYSGVLAVVLTVFGSAVYFTMRQQLLSRIDDGLEEELTDVVGEIDRAQDRQGMLHWLQRRFAHHEGFDFQVTDRSGGRVFANPRLGEQHLPVPEQIASQPRWESVSIPGEPPRRIITVQMEGPDGTLIVQVSRSLASFEHELGELLMVLLVVGPLTLLTAWAGGYWLARRALAPVDRMTEAANQISARQLDKRLLATNADDELGRLAATLNHMLDRLETGFQEMQRFTADASHELRTPITVIRTEAEVALQRPMSDEDKQNLLGSILEECQRLTWITDQLLVLSREDAGATRAVSEPVDMRALVHDVVGNVRQLAEAKNQQLTFDVEGSAWVQGDPERLRMVFYNLMNNAIKYTPEHGCIDVRASVDDSTFRFTVSDTGIGIPAEHHEKIFDRFYRVDKARSRAEGGAGLGLSIVKSVVAAHGGTVTVSSTADKGAVFTVTLPASNEGA